MFYRSASSLFTTSSKALFFRLRSSPSFPSHLPPSSFLSFLRRGYSSYPPGSQQEEEKEREVKKEKDEGQKSSHHQSKKRKKTSILTIQELYQKKEKISVMTAHDYPSAMVVQQAAVDVLLVGDSLAMVALGHHSTSNVTMEEMLHHCRAVARGATLPFLVGDMPFGSYQISQETAVLNATRFLKEGNMEAVKIEGGIEIAETARRIVRAGIPVLGHIGLTPQSQSALGGYRVQGKTADAALKLIKDAKALEDAGCFAVVVEAVPEPVGKVITEAISVPTIGIGAGKHVSGQVLVQLDLLGIFDKFVPKFCKQYAHLGSIIREALHAYHLEVKKGDFPGEEHTYPMDQEELEKFLVQVEKMKHFD